MRENKGSPNKVVYKVNKTTGKLMYTKESDTLKSYASDDYTSDLKPIDLFRVANFELATNYVRLFKTNVNTALKASGYSSRSFFRHLNNSGLKTGRENFLYKELRFYPSILFITTFARCLGISLHHLFDPSLPDKLKSGEVVVKIQFLPDKDE